jgi:hypothetical protein
MGNLLRSISLTVGQWLLVTATATIGVLVFLLRRQGTALHRTQVELLGARIDREQDKADASVARAMERYDAAMKAYLDSKGNK